MQKTKDGQKFMENVTFTPISGHFKAVMVLNGIQVLSNIYFLVPMVMAYFAIVTPDIVSPDLQNFILNFNFDAFSNELMGIAVLSGILLLDWFSKAYKNLYHFGHSTRNTPRWVVIDFFIPIVNLTAPYNNMKELYEKTIGEKPNKLVLGWWLTLLLASVSGSYLASSFITPDYDISTEIGIIIIGILLQSASLILAVLLLKKITDAQTTKAKISDKPQHQQQKQMPTS